MKYGSLERGKWQDDERKVRSVAESLFTCRTRVLREIILMF